MNFDIRKIDDINYIEESINEILEIIEKYAKTINNNHYIFDDFIKYDIEKIQEICTKYNVDIEEIKKYFELEKLSKSEYAKIFVETQSKILADLEIKKNIIIENLNKINDQIDAENNNIKQNISNIKTKLSELEQLKKILNEDMEVTKESLMIIQKLILNSDIEEAEKYELAKRICTKIIEKSLIKKDTKQEENEIVPEIHEEETQEEIYELEEPINIKICKEYYQKHQYIYKDYFNTYEETLSNGKIYLTEEMDNDNFVSKDNIVLEMCISLYKISKSNSQEEIENLSRRIDELEEKYQNYIYTLTNLESMLDDIKNKQQRYPKCNLHEERQKIYELIEKLQSGRVKNTNEILEQLIKINNIISSKLGNQYEETTSKKIKLKGFVIFDRNMEGSTYAENDLDINSKSECQIDSTIKTNKELLLSSISEYTKLIQDLFFLGEPATLHSDKSPSNIEKLLDRVYEDKTRKHPTGLRRIRPTTTSHVRFIERKVSIPKESTKYKQLISIIKEIVPSAIIEENEEFSIYLNVLSSFKTTDDQGYEIAKRRKNISILYKILFNDKTTSFTTEECAFIKESIQMTFDAIRKIQKNNPFYKFDILETLEESNGRKDSK